MEPRSNRPERPGCAMTGRSLGQFSRVGCNRQLPTQAIEIANTSATLPRNPMNSAASRPWRFVMSTEDNKALVRRWFEELDKRNFAIIDELIPEDYIDHNPPLPELPPGREGVRQASLRLFAAFPDAVHILDDQMAEGDKVMTRLTTRATFQGEILGLQPTGNVVEVSGVAVHRVANGRLVEHWAHLDMAGFMQQLGQETEPASRS